MIVIVCTLVSLGAITNTSNAQTKSLKLYYLHTGEKAVITFKKNGRFLPSGLKKINWFLRDWRRNEPTKMDPNLLDLIWEVYRQSGSRKYIHVISGYRSLASNNLLRRRGHGVAKHSQHTKGKALDFFLPDVKLSKLREIGLKLQVGGVGFYPTSGSPFVHMDTGNVRHWPRMTRKQLARVFPDGKTMHIPSDGKPLAKYKQAVASYKRRAATGSLVPNAKKGENNLSFFKRLASLNKDDEGDGQESNSATAPRSVKTTVKTINKTAPKPAPELAVEAKGTEFAALPANIPVPILAPRGTTSKQDTQIQIATAEPLTAPLEDPAATLVDQAANPQLTQTADGTPPDATIKLAGLSLPIPTKAPRSKIIPISNTSVQTALNSVVKKPAATEPSASVLALSEPKREPKSVDPVSGNTQFAALTPQEIEDLRAQARPTISAASIVAPTPAASIPSVETAAIQPVENAEEPVAKSDIAETDKAQNEIVSDFVVASLPVPLPSPRAMIKKMEVEHISIKEPTDSATQLAKAEPAMPTLTPRTISLDKLSAPQVNTSTVGKWALANEKTIRQLAKVRAPAYGRNVIRQVPNSILVQSFDLQPFGPGQNNFKGKAVTAMRFASLKLQ